MSPSSDLRQWALAVRRAQRLLFVISRARETADTSECVLYLVTARHHAKLLASSLVALQAELLSDQPPENGAH